MRLVHPFPSLLDGLATAVIAALAGGWPASAVRLGAAMTFLQFGIGAANDVIDAPREQARTEKPIVSGVISRSLASSVAAGCLVVGIALTAPSGAPVLAIATLGAADGLLYDLGLKRTPWAWLPFSVGIPLLVVFAWYGGAGRLPAELLVMAPAAALAGAALALGNGLVDPDRDRTAGLATPVVGLGPSRAWRAAIVLHAATVALAIASLVAIRTSAPAVLAAFGAGGLGALGLIGERDDRRDRRERGWELHAIGIAVLGASWAAGVVLR